MLAVELLARAKDGEGVKSGPIGLAVILVLCVAAYFLFKSMSKHLKRVREDFPTDEAGNPKPAEEVPAESKEPGQSADAEPTAEAASSPPTAESP